LGVLFLMGEHMAYLGRRKIYTDVEQITIDNIKAVVRSAMTTHEANRIEMKKLFEYEKGDQTILYREKKVRPEIDFRMVENHASEIVDFTVGYQAGNPINLVSRSIFGDLSKDKHSDRRIVKLNEMFTSEFKHSKDIELFRNFYICGLGYMACLPKSNPLEFSPFDLLVLNPLNTFVVYSNDAYAKPLLAVTYKVLKDSEIKKITAYSENSVFEFRLDEATNPVETVNIIGAIPIVEFHSNDDLMGCFEKVIPLLDAINLINSDRANDIAQFVQSILWMHNAELDENAQKELAEGNGFVFTKSTGNGQDAKLTYLTQTLNQKETQTYVDYLYKQLLQICGVPGRDKSTGGNTGSAMYLSNGYEQAESRAKAMESLYTRSAMKLLDVCLRIIKLSPNIDAEIKTLEVNDIDIEFSRDRTYDIASRTNSLATMLNMGIEPLHAMRVVDLFNDVETVYEDSKERMDDVLLGKTEQIDNKVNVDATGAGINLTASTMGGVENAKYINS